MEFDAYAIRREPMDGLYVQRRTLGKSHRFSFPAGVVSLTLPGFESPAVEKRESLVDFPDHPDHTWYEVAWLDARVDLHRRISFEGTEAQFNSNAAASGSGEEAFNAAQQTLEDALDVWKRTVRWTALAPAIGLSDVAPSRERSAMRDLKLLRKSDDAVFRNHGGTLSLGGGGKVSAESWQSAADALAGGERPPTWFDYLHEARRRQWVGDLRAAIVNAAIGSETLIRAAFQRTLPKIQSPLALRILDTTPVQSLLGRWEEIIPWDKRTAKAFGKSEVHELFDLRNTVMHSGLDARDRLIRVSELLPKITLFVLKGDAHLTSTGGGVKRIFPADGVEQRLTTSA